MAKRKHNVKVQVEMSVDIHIPFRKRQFLAKGGVYNVDEQVAGFLFGGKYARPVTTMVV
jgi:hypothetical protein